MRGEFGLNRVSLALFLLAAVAGVAGCQRNQPPQPAPPPSPAPEATQPYSTSFSASGWTYHLRPLKPDAQADADKAREVWRDLFPGMAKDQKTRELLKRLHADLPVEFLVLDAKQAEDTAALKAAPPEGAAVVMRVADISHKEEKSKAGSVPVRVIAYGRVILLKDATAPGNWKALAENMKTEPLPGGPLSLAMEDYVQRQVPGWAVIGGPFFEHESLPASVEEQHRDLDKRIKEYQNHAKAFFGARRKH